MIVIVRNSNLSQLENSNNNTNELSCIYVTKTRSNAKFNFFILNYSIIMFLRFSLLCKEFELYHLCQVFIHNFHCSFRYLYAHWHHNLLANQMEPIQSIFCFLILFSPNREIEFKLHLKTYD